MEKATDIILVICGTLLCVGGMFSVGDTFRSVTGIVLGLALVVLGLVDKDRAWPFGKGKRKHGTECGDCLLYTSERAVGGRDFCPAKRRTRNRANEVPPCLCLVRVRRYFGR